MSNSCRKWNRIFLFLFYFTVHCLWCLPLFDELSQCLKQRSIYAYGNRSWAVYNLTFALLGFALPHSTTEVPYILLALYSLRSGTLKRVNDDATSAVCKDIILYNMCLTTLKLATQFLHMSTFLHPTGVKGATSLGLVGQ